MNISRKTDLFVFLVVYFALSLVLQKETSFPMNSWTNCISSNECSLLKPLHQHISGGRFGNICKSIFEIRKMKSQNICIEIMHAE